eukprot:5244771-Amphidinium_carterae.2
MLYTLSTIIYSYCALTLFVPPNTKPKKDKKTQNTTYTRECKGLLQNDHSQQWPNTPARSKVNNLPFLYKWIYFPDY